MQVQHIGFVCRNATNAEKFYGEFLGLKKTQLTTVSAAVIRALFGLDMDLPMLHYQGPNVDFEIFYLDDPKEFTGRIAHTCLKLREADGLLERAAAHGVKVTRVPRGEKYVIFIEDFDGNRFEIKSS